MKEYLSSVKEEMFCLLESIVNIDSGSYHKKGTDEVGRIFQSEYEKLGLSCEIYPQEKVGDHLKFQSYENSNPRILIVGHMDTVFPEGTVRERSFFSDGTKAYGPGVIDMKASLVSVLYALKALKKMGETAYKNVQVFMNSDEELGSFTSRPFIEKAAKGKDYALIVEPSRGEKDYIVTHRKGLGRFSLKITGKAAHAGQEPEKGISAIHELSHKIVQLQALNSPETGVTVNVGLIEGGTSVNTVSSDATGRIDIRMKTGDQAKLLLKKIQDICSKSVINGTHSKLTGGITRPPMVKDQKVQKLLEIVQEEGEKLGIDIEDTFTGGGSDGCFTSSIGTPTIDGMGPAGGRAHSDEEYLKISTFYERTLLLAHTIKRLSK